MRSAFALATRSASVGCELRGGLFFFFWASDAEAAANSKTTRSEPAIPAFNRLATLVRLFARLLISNLLSIVTLRDSPALNHHHVTIRFEPNTDLVFSIWPPRFSTREHVDHFSVPDHAGECSEPHDVPHSNRSHHVRPRFSRVL